MNTEIHQRQRWIRYWKAMLPIVVGVGIVLVAALSMVDVGKELYVVADQARRPYLGMPGYYNGDKVAELTRKEFVDGDKVRLTFKVFSTESMWDRLRLRFDHGVHARLCRATTTVYFDTFEVTRQFQVVGENTPVKGSSVVFKRGADTDVVQDTFEAQLRRPLAGVDYDDAFIEVFWPHVGGLDYGYPVGWRGKESEGVITDLSSGVSPDGAPGWWVKICFPGYRPENCPYNREGTEFYINTFYNVVLRTWGVETLFTGPGVAIREAPNGASLNASGRFVGQQGPPPPRDYSPADFHQAVVCSSVNLLERWAPVYGHQMKRIGYVVEIDDRAEPARVTIVHSGVGQDTPERSRFTKVGVLAYINDARLDLRNPDRDLSPMLSGPYLVLYADPLWPDAPVADELRCQEGTPPRGLQPDAEEQELWLEMDRSLPVGTRITFKGMTCGYLRRIEVRSGHRVRGIVRMYPQAFPLLRQGMAFRLVPPLEIGEFGLRNLVRNEGIDFQFGGIESLIGSVIEFRSPEQGKRLVLRREHPPVFPLHLEPPSGWDAMAINHVPLRTHGSADRELLGVTLPNTYRVYFRWRRSKWSNLLAGEGGDALHSGFNTVNARCLRIGSYLVAPTEALKPNEDRSQIKSSQTVFRVDGKAVARETVAYRNVATGVVAAKFNGLSSAVAKTPAELVGFAAQPVDVWVLTPEPLAIEMTDLRQSRSGWLVDPDVAVPERWNGCAVVSRSHDHDFGKVIGLVRAFSGEPARVVPFPKDLVRQLGGV